MTECISPCNGQLSPRRQFAGCAVLAALFFSLASGSASAEMIYYSSGSGFFVNLQGQVVTNAHVLNKGCKSVEIRSQGAVYPANIIAMDEAHDLAMVQAPTYPGPSPLMLRDESMPIKENETALALGFPGDATELKIAPSSILESDAEISDKNGSSDHYITFRTAVTHGNSGGPLVDEAGNVIGVVRGMGQKSMMNAGSAQVEKIYDMDIAITGKTLRDFLNQNRINYQTRTSDYRWDSDLIRVRLISSVPNVRCVLNEKPSA